MPRRWMLLITALLALVFAAFAACGGGGEEKATQTPAKPTAATPTRAAAGTPTGPTFTGSATASVKVGEQSFTFKDGRCDKGDDDAWLAVNIGQVAGNEYFGLLVGAYPGAPEGTKSAKGGGVFATAGGFALSGTQAGSTFVMAGGVGENKLTLAADLKSGEFVGTTIDGKPISGSFKC